MTEMRIPKVGEWVTIRTSSGSEYTGPVVPYNNEDDGVVFTIREGGAHTNGWHYSICTGEGWATDRTWEIVDAPPPPPVKLTVEVTHDELEALAERPFVGGSVRACAYNKLIDAAKIACV